MLTAWDNNKGSILAVPDYEEGEDLILLRQWAHDGRVVCPVCREKLWLRAGTERCVHLAHRVLANCPHGRVSFGVVEARRLLYRFFQDRIGSGKLLGLIELEPAVAGLPEEAHVDLILRRE